MARPDIFRKKAPSIHWPSFEEIGYGDCDNMRRSSLIDPHSGLPVGKEAGPYIYVYRDYEEAYGDEAMGLLEDALLMIDPDLSHSYNVLAYDKRSGNFLFSQSPDFLYSHEPYIWLQQRANPLTGEVATLREHGPENPLIYHHKWMFVADDFDDFVPVDPSRWDSGLEESRARSVEWKQLYLPRSVENRIGRRRYWDDNVLAYLDIGDYPPDSRIFDVYNPEMSAYTARGRTTSSKPLSLLMRRGMLPMPPASILDFGSGLGADVEYLLRSGYDVIGYDPHQEPTEFTTDDLSFGDRFDAVLCTYVLNVIAEPADRTEVLQECRQRLDRGGMLAVTTRSPQDISRECQPNWMPYNDGFITPKGTFQVGISPETIANAMKAIGLSSIRALSRSSSHSIVIGYRQ